MIDEASHTSEEKALFDLELKISKLLRYGVMIAGILMLAGWLPHLNFAGGNPLAAFHDYQAFPFFSALAQAWAARDIPTLLSQVGLIALISLPFLRVLMTAVLFLRQKDFALAGLASFVLVVLIISCLLGLEL